MKDIDLITKKHTEEIVLETKCSETVETLKTEPAVVLSKRIDNEISRATEAEKGLDSKIDAETARATAREDELESKIKQSGKVDDVLVNDVSVLGEDKIARIDLTPYAKQSDLSSEIDRAKESESSLSSSLDIVKSDLASETSAREEADKTLQANIDANEEAITAETTRATTKETELENAIKEAGKIDDVKVNDVSVVTDKVANIDLTDYITLSTDQTITGEKTIANDFNTQSILPISAGTYSLGSEELYYKDLYLSNITIPSLSGEYKFVFKATNNGVSIGNADYKGNYMEFIRTHGYGISLYNTLEPNTDNKWSLGAENYRFKDLYLSGSISDKSNSITVSEIVAKQDKLIAGDNIAISDDNVISSDLSDYAKASELAVEISERKAGDSDTLTAAKAYTDQEKVNYVLKSGDTMTGALHVPQINTNTTTTSVAINTGTDANSYFQAQKFRGQGNASTYNHAIDFGYVGHDRVDFYEYGGVYNFWQNQGSSKLEGDKNRVASLQLGKLLERGYTLTYPGKSGTFALTSDFADYATTAYVDEKTALPKITITKDQFTSSKSIKLTDEQNAILIDTNNDAVLVDLSSFGGTYPNIVLHRQISSAWLFLFTSAWNAELFTLENGVARLKKFLVLTGINDGAQPNYPTADIVDLDTIDFPTITLSKSQITSVSEDGNSMELTLTDNQYNILCDSLYRAVKVNASNIGLWNDGVIYKLNDDSTDPVYTFFSVSASEAGIGRIFIDSDRTAKVYITYAVSQEEASQLKEEITTQLTNLQTALSTEAKTREESDNTLQTNLNQEIADRKTSDSDLNITITNSLTEAKAYTDSEAKLREQGDADTLSSAKSYIDKMIEQNLSALSVDGGEVTA